MSNKRWSSLFSRLNQSRDKLQSDLSTNDQTDFLIQNSLKTLEESFDRIEKNVLNTRAHVLDSHDQFSSKLSEYLNPEFSKFRNEIKIKQKELKNKLKFNSNFGICYFFENTKSLSEILGEIFYYVNRNFDNYRKIKYLNFYDQYEILDSNRLDEECYNYIIIPLSRYKIFYCMALFYKKSYLKIADRNGQELHRREINKNYYYRKFILLGNYIAGLYDDIKSGMNLIELYNDELNLVASKMFNHKLDLVYMDQLELVCKSKQTKNLYFFLIIN